jgi:aldehyde dehydrogenase (NAD+)
MRTFAELYIAGEWTPSDGDTMLTVDNPATGQVIAEVIAATADDVDRAVTAARHAFESWAATSPATRAEYLSAIAQSLTARTNELAELITTEMGCPIGFARAVQVPLGVNSFAQAAAVITEYPFESQYRGSTILREPFGVVGAITPWNYPLHQIALKTAYALAAGNTIVVKPSEIAPLNAFALADIVHEVGLPAGVFNLVSGSGPVAGEALVSHPDVDVVSFTGSTQAGRRVSELASRSIKKVSLELGGKSPNVVLDDADLTAAVPAAVHAAMANSGQTCSALTRLLVPRDRLGEVERIAAAVVEAIKVGDPQDDSTQMGPLSSRVQQRRVAEYIRTGIAEGARVIVGGAVDLDATPGAFVEPTVFSDVTAGMTIHEEEIFGPVLVIEPYESEADAVTLANSTAYGLAAGVWSASPQRARGVARRIRAGLVSINDATLNLDAPFGGYKQSGNGREAGLYGLEEFLEIKAIHE